jgi:hypothetical protein
VEAAHQHEYWLDRPRPGLRCWAVPSSSTWATDASEVITALAALAWPVIVGVIAWRLRGKLPGLARRVRRLRLAGAEADLDPQLRQLDEAADEAEADVRPQLPSAATTSEQEVADSILQLAAQDARLGVVMLVTEIEEMSKATRPAGIRLPAASRARTRKGR